MLMIDRFRGEYSFLSNFYEHPVAYNGQIFRNSEAAFQAQKTEDPAQRLAFTTMTAAEAKRAGRRVTLRPDWEEIKDQVMYEILMAKFSDPVLKKKLVDTKPAMLVEGNRHHDNYWGICSCPRCGGHGDNVLGKLLRKVRSAYREEVLHYDRYTMEDCDIAARKTIMAYSRKLIELAKANMDDIRIAMEEDSITHLWMDGCGDQYIAMAQEIEKRGFRRVIDIGCCTGYQDYYFKAHGIEAIGIDSHVTPCVDPSPMKIIQLTYPAPLRNAIEYDPEETIGVSSLCLSYLGDIEGMFRQAAQDFKQMIITMNQDSIPIAEKYFRLEQLDQDLYWMTLKSS